MIVLFALTALAADPFALAPPVDGSVVALTGLVDLGDVALYAHGTGGHDPRATPQIWFASEHLWGPDAALARRLSTESVEAWDADHAHREAAARASDVLLLGVPLAGLGIVAAAPLAEHRGATPALVDGVLVFESLTTSYAVDAVVKHAVGRPRPYTYTTAYTRCAQFRGGASTSTCEPLFDKSIADNFSSYWSGHSSTTFAAAASVTTVLLLDRDGHPGWVPAVAGVALFGLAGTTAWLRVASDRHFPSDVLIGALAGTAIGVLVPVAHLHGLPPLAMITPHETTTTLLAFRGSW